MERIGHMGDGFVALREIAEAGKQERELREWAVAVADHLGEHLNLAAFWPVTRSYRIWSKAGADRRGRMLWGPGPVPVGAEITGVVVRSDEDGIGGALIRLENGIYVQGNAAAVRTLSQGEVRRALAVYSVRV